METEILSSDTFCLKLHMWLLEWKEVCGEGGDICWTSRVGEGAHGGREPWAVGCLRFSLLGPSTAGMGAGRDQDLASTTMARQL